MNENGVSYTGQVSYIDRMPAKLPTAVQRTAYFVGVCFSELHKVLAIADASAMKQVKQGFRMFPGTILNERLRMANNVMRQVNGTCDEVENSTTLTETIKDGQGLWNDFMNMDQGGPQSIRLNRAELAKYANKSTAEYVDIPVIQQE
tara:strand:+ start:143 stop:583 length:441 start_codon:yes stop_codon:yes gene_type:complete